MEGVWAIAASGSRAISTVNAPFFHNLLLSNDLSATKFGHACCVFVSYMLHCCYKKLLEGRTAMGAVLIFLWLDLVSCFY